MFAFGSWQGTAGFQRLELTVANVGTTGLPLQGNCRFPTGWKLLVPNLGTMGLPLQATAGYQRLELMLPNLGTTGYHCKELPVPKGWKLMVPNVGNQRFTMARNCRFPDVETCGSQLGNQRLPLQTNCRFPEVRIYVFEAKQLSLEGTAGSESLKTHGSKPEKAYVTSGRIC